MTKKLDSKDIHIIQELRKNSRAKLSTIAQKTKTPLSTTHERLYKLVSQGMVKPVTLPAFEKCSFPIRCWFVIQTKNRSDCVALCANSNHTNTLLTIHNGADVLCECVFSSFQEQHDFLQEIRKYGKVHVFAVLEAVKQEGASITGLRMRLDS